MIAVLAVAAGIIMVNFGNASTYANFTEAEEMAANGKKKSIHVVGALHRDDNGEITGILPSESQMEFSFLLVDNEGREEKVYYAKPMPADFMESEQVVVIGGYREENGEQYFLAEKILLKCPSKYEDTEFREA